MSNLENMLKQAVLNKARSNESDRQHLRKRLQAARGRAVLE